MPWFASCTCKPDFSNNFVKVLLGILEQVYHYMNCGLFLSKMVATTVGSSILSVNILQKQIRCILNDKF